MRAPTLRDVARHAGVSMGTVSHVLNHPQKVSESTIAKVRASIEELGFVRDANASSLAAGGSRSIGLVVIDLGNSMFVDVARGAQEAARDAGLNLMLAASQDDFAAQGENVDFFAEARVAGLLLAPLQDSSEQMRRFSARGRPAILVNYDPGDEGVCCVVVDNEQVGYLAARHLIEQGCRRLLFVCGDEAIQPVTLRRAGLRRAVSEAKGVRFEEVHTPDLTEQSGAALAHRVAARGPGTRPDGIVTVTDTLAAGFMNAAEALGISVPRDMAVMGCDDNRLAEPTTVGLSTVAMEGKALGGAAIRMLLEELSAAAGIPHVHQRIVVEPRLIPRRSTLGFERG
ncbi:LacI family DNA-binding transcriptional regulator [Microbacterium trichothecenolyticum]|nr:LacI family DNA-binding transcriptional regulator [Microbacterium trichothecenolyticum]MBW9122421.1 LacI family DNA-binding transcriptional regulator [Microbacterium trichothecenolyticum]